MNRLFLRSWSQKWGFSRWQILRHSPLLTTTHFYLYLQIVFNIYFVFLSAHPATSVKMETTQKVATRLKNAMKWQTLPAPTARSHRRAATTPTTYSARTASSPQSQSVRTTRHSSATTTTAIRASNSKETSTNQRRPAPTSPVPWACKHKRLHASKRASPSTRPPSSSAPRPPLSKRSSSWPQPPAEMGNCYLKRNSITKYISNYFYND